MTGPQTVISIYEINWKFNRKLDFLLRDVMQFSKYSLTSTFAHITIIYLILENTYNTLPYFTIYSQHTPFFRTSLGNLNTIT